MITKINISNVATFKEENIEDLKKVNFFYGVNGSGKTTISRIINSPELFNECKLEWNSNILEIRVFNRDFIDKNFKSMLDGIFTLGEENVEVQEKIKNLKEENDRLARDIENINKQLKGENDNIGRENELLKVEEEYNNKFWKIKKNHENDFSKFFEGFKSSKKNLKNKVLDEYINRKDVYIQIDELKEKYKILFSTDLSFISPLSQIDSSEIQEIEDHKILSKIIIGKEHVDIAPIIEKLHNSDWVHAGIKYYTENDLICPFCQQKTNNDLISKLEEYFDDQFTNELNQLEELKNKYLELSSKLETQIYNPLFKNYTKFIIEDTLNPLREKLITILSQNKNKIISKINEPSKKISLVPIKNIVDSINDIIISANIKIQENNKYYDNKTSEISNLKKEFWNTIVNINIEMIKEYKEKIEYLQDIIYKLKDKITDKSSKINNNEVEIMNLESSNAGILKTLKDINKILESFGFFSFRLKQVENKNLYEIIRNNGDIAENLSEGERNFLSFLYFFYMLNGSQSKNGISNEKIVVFDDPISSLDSNVLFIVSNLIKSLFEDLDNDTGNIKQIFVLTHNVYFFKEVSFNRVRNGNPQGSTSFWYVKKMKNYSTIINQNKDPIKTSYELLWFELQENNRNPVTIKNVMRRIIEYYFKFTGKIGIKCLSSRSEFSSQEKIICDILCSWCHDGSHQISDDISFCDTDEQTVDVYLSVFRKIFEITNNIDHYNLMMNI